MLAMFGESDFVSVKLPSTWNVKSVDWCFGCSRPPQVLSPSDLDTCFVSCESDAKSYGCDIFHLCTGVICCSVNIARACTSAGPFLLSSKTVSTFISTTSGCTDQHAAHSTHTQGGEEWSPLPRKQYSKHFMRWASPESPVTDGATWKAVAWCSAVPDRHHQDALRPVLTLSKKSFWEGTDPPVHRK